MTNTINNAQSTSFIGFIQNNRDLTYRIQSTNLGALILNPAEMPARYANIPFPGDKIIFNQLTVQFSLDENLSQWVELNRWMFDLANNNDDVSSFEIKVYDRQHQETVRITYFNLFPTSLSDLDFSVVDEESNLVMTCDFVYSHYEIENLKTGDVIRYDRTEGSNQRQSRLN